jgi:putative restriction endonuclease
VSLEAVINDRFVRKTPGSTEINCQRRQMKSEAEPDGPLASEYNTHRDSMGSWSSLSRCEIALSGIFAYANALQCSLAWEAFRESNGASAAHEMRARIARYRRADPGDRSDFEIGCRILTQPFFLAERDWILVPTNWSPNIVSFETYNTGNADGLALWEAVNDRLGRLQDASVPSEQARFGEPQLIRPRLGQGAFRVLVTDIYRRRCAVTQERTLPALEAAHIRPFGDGGEHDARNGLLLRRDIHSLFDAGYVTVTPDLRFEVSRRIREEFETASTTTRFMATRSTSRQMSGCAPIDLAQ